MKSTAAMLKEDQRKLAYVHLDATYPMLRAVFQAVGKPDISNKETPPLYESVVSIIVGQMLSGAAANTIFSRLQAATAARALEGPHLLSEEDLRAAGLSKAKARAISEFAQAMKNDPQRFKAWRQLNYSDFVSDVTKLWGMSSWSASILALSHFGMADVWPSADGSIKRAVRRIHESIDNEFDPELAAPYRSFLARSLWAALDQRVI